MTFPTSALLKRELRTTMRSRRAYLLLVLAAGLIFLVVSFFLYEANSMRAFGGPAMSQYVFAAITVGLYIAMLLSIPAMAATAIVTERTQGNYDLLMTTLIRPSGVLFGKMAHIVGMYCLLVIAVLPLVGVCYFFVGVEWNQLLLAAGSLLVTAVALCTLGLFASSVVQSTRGAVFGAYFLLAIFQGVAVLTVVSVFEFLAFSGSREYFNPPEWLFEIFLPYMAIVGALNPAGSDLTTFALNILFQCAWTLLFFTFTVWRLRRPWEPATQGATGDRVRKAFRMRKPARGSSLPPIPLRRNAMHMKELRASRLGHGKMRAVLWLAFFGACLLLNIDNFDGMRDESFFLLVAQCMVITFIAPAAIATSYAKEIERQNVDMLRATLLTPLEIAWGKYLAALSMVLTLYTAALAALVISSYVVDVPLHFYLYFAQVAFLMLFALSFGGAMGARFRRSGTALLGAYLGGFVFLIVLPWMLFMFLSILGLTQAPPTFLAGLYPPVLIYPYQPGQRGAEIAVTGIICTALYSLVLFRLYWRAGTRILTREPIHGGQ